MAVGNNKGLIRRAVDASSIGISMVVATFGGLFVGIYLDSIFYTKPWLTIIFLIIGIAAGFKNVYELLKKYNS